MWCLGKCPVCVSISNRDAARRIALLVAIATLGISCKKHEVSIEELDTSPDMPVSVMPNVKARIVSGAKNASLIPLQGSWYWYQAQTTAETARVSVVLSQEDKDTDVVWFDNTRKDESYADSLGNFNSDSHTQVSRICTEGKASTSDDFLGLGFELCSPNNGVPAELPRTLGGCSNDSRIPYYFWGVSFHVAWSKFSYLDVEFRKWGGIDDKHPKCIADNPTQEDKLPPESECHTEEDATGMTVYAYARKLGDINLNLLQQINIQFHGDTSGKPDEPNRICISDVNVWVSRKDDNKNDTEVWSSDFDMQPDTNTFGDQFDTETDSNLENRYETEIDAEDRTEKSKIEWISIKKEGKPPSEFNQIMKKEVTVGQYLEWIGGHDLEWGWEGCTVHHFGKKKPDTAANCISWYRAKAFCDWLGGALPDEALWNHVLLNQVKPKSATCENAVLKAEDLVGTADGCGNKHAMPAQGCSFPNQVTDAGTDEELPCDMIGNLWEWVDKPDPTIESGLLDKNECKGFKLLKGLGFSSKATEWKTGDTPDNTEFTTCEHPGIPRVPLRIGFRCVRQDPDKKESTDSK